MHRFSATRVLLRHVGEMPVVANLGPTTDELWHAGHRDRNFYTYGSMGLCTSIALGMALSTTEKVISFDGDGSLLMNMGTIASIARDTCPRASSRCAERKLSVNIRRPTRPPKDACHI